MNSLSKKFYLGKKGKSFGPFTTAEIEAMRLSGELEAYSYLWNDSDQSWKTIEAAPPPPGLTPAPQISEHQYEAICHDTNTIVSGALENVSESGCDLICRDNSDSPRLGVKALLMLNVLDNAGKKAVNVKASLSEIVRREKTWVYRLRWARLPF